MPAFDHSRIDPALYANLQQARPTVRFLRMVVDYTDHLRAIPHDTEDEWQDAQELEAMQRFITMIDDDNVWPSVKPFVVEFANSPIVQPQGHPFHELLQRLEHRRVPPSIPRREERLEQFEAGLLWTRQKTNIAYVARMTMESPATGDDEIEKEIEEAEATVMAIFNAHNPFNGQFREGRRNRRVIGLNEDADEVDQDLPQGL